MDITACHERLSAQLRSLSTTPLLLFGYASLIWRPDVNFTSSQRACAGGFHRRLWQASPDHRGTPSALGRVATLVPACPRAWRARLAGSPPAAAEWEGRALRAWLARCGGGGGGGGGGAAAVGEAAAAEEAEEEEGAPVVHGTVFTLEKECARAMLEKLCVRERAGYQLLCVQLALEEGGEVDAYTFSGATAGSGFGAEFWAPAPPAELALVVATAEGASGRNLEYFVELLRSMRGWKVADAHLEAIWGALMREHRAAVFALLGDARASELELGGGPPV